MSDNVVGPLVYGCRPLVQAVPPSPATQGKQESVLGRLLKEKKRLTDEGIFAQPAIQAELAIVAQAHPYSADNNILIWLQLRERAQPLDSISDLRGFVGWLEAGRAVRKGEKALHILSPIVRSGKATEGNAEESRPKSFKPAYVFDVSQTDAKPPNAGALHPEASEREPRRFPTPTYEAPNPAQVAAHFRALADFMEKEITRKRDPAIGHQRPTARRARIADHIIRDGERLARVQGVLVALAVAWERGEVPPILEQVRTKASIIHLLEYASYPERINGKAHPLSNARNITSANYGEARAAVLALVPAVAPEDERIAKIKRLERALIGMPIPGYFPTPPPIVARMIAAAELAPGLQILEPSAGKGNIADAIRAACPDVVISVLECVTDLRHILELKGYAIVGNDFLAHQGAYDRILMNPPFEEGHDRAHVRHAYECLAPGGILVSIMGEASFVLQGQKYANFRAWLASINAQHESLPTGSFLASERSTGTATHFVVARKA